MQVIESGSGYALCQGRGRQERVDTLLVGDQPVGTWLLIFLNSAREVLSAEDAAKILGALEALDNIMQGEVDNDHLFADLIEREPQLPEHLQSKLTKQAVGE